MSSTACNAAASCCGGSTPSVRTVSSGTKLWWQSISLAPRRRRFDSCRLHPCLRSVNGSTRPLYGRGAGSIPAGGFSRLDARSSVESTALIRQRPLVRLQPGASRGRSSVGRASGRHPGEARSIRVVRSLGPWCNREHGELQPRWSGFESWRACSSRAEVARLSGTAGSTPASELRAHDRDVCSAAGRNGSGYRLLIDRSRVRVPLGALALR